MRRAAKAKERRRERHRRQEAHGQASARGTGGWGGDPFDLTDSERASMVLDAAVAAHIRDERAVRDELTSVLTRLPRELVEREVRDELLRAMPALWSGGWQPSEIVRHARRSDARAGRLVAAAVLANHRQRQPETLHPKWADQVAQLAASHAAPSRDWVGAFVSAESLSASAFAEVAVRAVAACVGVGRLPIILPPPGTTSPAALRDLSTPDDAVLAKVRALLSQAESTTFEAEAETFTAKAQELMARHAIDMAVVWQQSGREEEPATIRIPIDDPYADAKSLLLHVVAEHSRCRAVVLEAYALCSVLGFASDIEACELLFTSLLVQSQVALRAEAATAPPGSRVRSRGFRSSFLLAYAHRIGDRLRAVNQTVESEAAAADGTLLPVLAARTSEVDDAVEEMFGDLKKMQVRGGTDHLGWARGELAADRARLNRADLAGAAKALPEIG